MSHKIYRSWNFLCKCAPREQRENILHGEDERWYLERGIHFLFYSSFKKVFAPFLYIYFYFGLLLYQKGYQTDILYVCVCMYAPPFEQNQGNISILAFILENFLSCKSNRSSNCNKKKRKEMLREKSRDQIIYPCFYFKSYVKRKRRDERWWW